MIQKIGILSELIRFAFAVEHFQNLDKIDNLQTENQYNPKQPDSKNVIEFIPVKTNFQEHEQHHQRCHNHQFQPGVCSQTMFHPVTDNQVLQYS